MFYNVIYIEGFHRNPSLFIAGHSLIQDIPFFKDRFHRKQCIQYAWKSRIGDAVGADRQFVSMCSYRNQTIGRL